MLNHFTDIMAGSYLDQCCADETVCGEFFSLYGGQSARQSLQTRCELWACSPSTRPPRAALNPTNSLLQTGAPTEWFDDEHLCAPLQDVLPALGKTDPCLAVANAYHGASTRRAARRQGRLVTRSRDDGRGFGDEREALAGGSLMSAAELAAAVAQAKADAEPARVIYRT